MIAKLLYNLECMYVRPKHFGGNVIFSGPIQDRQLKCLGIKQVHILHISIKFHKDLLIGFQVIMIFLTLIRRLKFVGIK